MVTLLLPTALMGATLPWITRACLRQSTSSTEIGLLYGINMLGGAIGAIGTPWLLIPFFGISGTVSIAATLNLLIALVSFGLKERIAYDAVTREEERPNASPPSLDSPPLIFWTVLYFLSGMVAIGLEMIWFRIVEVATKSTSFTFGTVLGVYLATMALGSIFGSRWYAKSVRPLQAFLWMQWGVLLTAVLPVWLLSAIPERSWLVEYWAQSVPFFPTWDRPGMTLLLYGLFPFLLFGVATFLMGASFGCLQRGVASQGLSAGYRVGVLQSANIAGCAVGGLLVGLVAMDEWGTIPSLRLLLSTGWILSVIAILKTRHRLLFLVPALGSLVLSFLLSPNEEFWLWLHGQTRREGMVLKEDATGVVAILPEREGEFWRLAANGKSQSLLPYGTFHSKLGALPVTLHDEPRKVAIIGLGSGGTAWAAACREETERVTVFEIFRAELPALREAAPSHRWPQVQTLLNDARVEFRTDDARRALMMESTRYDVIEADAIRPSGAYAGYLYSLEFFRLCSERLRPNGLMVTWSPTTGTYSTFRRVFPYVIDLDGGSTLIGSQQPIRFDPTEWKRRLQQPNVRAYLSDTVLQECVGAIERAFLAPPFHPSEWTNSDLFPYDEFHGETKPIEAKE